jgi:hypothetical protein
MEHESAPIEVVRIIFTTEDIRAMARDAGIDEDIAVDRVLDWGKYVADTFTTHVSEQLDSIVRTGQP